MKKNVLRVLALAVLMCLLTAFVSAEEVKPVYVMLNGEYVDCASYGQEATIVEGRTMVPLRAIFESLGATVEWNQETKTVSSVLGDTEISLTIGDSKLIKNGEEIALDVPALIMNGRTLVPVRAVSESFGVAVEWDKNTRTVILTQAEKPLDEKPETPAQDDADVPEAAKLALTKCLDATLSFNLNEAAKYTTTPEAFDSINMSGIDDMLKELGLDHETVTEMYMASVGEGHEDAIVFCEDVADVCVDITKRVYSMITYEVVSYKAVSENEVAAEVLLYFPDLETFSEDFENMTAYATAMASEELLMMAQQFEGSTEKEVYDVLGQLFKKYAEPAVDELIEGIALVPVGEAEEENIVKVNGTWLVELDEEDMQGLSSLAENGFAGLLG
jgi:hypothetical protein